MQCYGLPLQLYVVPHNLHAHQHTLQTPDGTEDLTQVLTDLCNVSGPWSRVLRTLRDELVRSVYSDYYAMEQQGLQFSQLPYYKAAERLEADNKHLLQEREAFKKLLLQRQVLQTISFCFKSIGIVLMFLSLLCRWFPETGKLILTT